MNRLGIKERAKIIGCLVEGNSIRATCRMTGAARGTVIKLLADVGAACQHFHDQRVMMIETKRIQCDEIWSFYYAKDKNVPAEMRGVYLTTVPQAFGKDIDFGIVNKIYGQPKGGVGHYSPGECCGMTRKKVIGKPIERAISTSYVERQNLTMRMSMRRFTRPTNAFSKKVENLGHAVALHFMFYNFRRIHQSLRVTPAMQACLTDHVWSLEEIATLADQQQPMKLAA